LVSIKSARRIGAIAAILAGLEHELGIVSTSVLAPMLYRQLFGQAVIPVTIFFVILGAFQLIWAAIILRSNSRLLIIVGIVGFLASIVIYLASTVIELPPGVPVQSVNPYAIVSKILEAIFIYASILVLRSSRLSEQQIHEA